MTNLFEIRCRLGRGSIIPGAAATEKLRLASGFAFRGNRLAREETVRGVNMLLGTDGCPQAVEVWCLDAVELEVGVSGKFTT